MSVICLAGLPQEGQGNLRSQLNINVLYKINRNLTYKCRHVVYLSKNNRTIKISASKMKLMVECDYLRSEHYKILILK
jgi:hypothetical protein